MRGLFAGALLAAVIAACAQKSAAPPQAAEPAVTDWRRDEITNLWMQIRGWRIELRMSADPLLVQPYYPAIPAIRECRAEREPTTELCQDTCSLKDGICDNAEDICRIANDLGNDPWAESKCESAKASCKEATEKCCKCIEKEAKAEPAAPER